MSAWTKTHQQEALPRLLELAAAQMRAGRYDGDKLEELTEDAKREDWWRRALAEIGLDAARIDREVHRVDGLATGRLVREVVWRIRFKRGTRHVECVSLDLARIWRDYHAPGERIIRVTRIRRAP